MTVRAAYAILTQTLVSMHYDPSLIKQWPPLLPKCTKSSCPTVWVPSTLIKLLLLSLCQDLTGGQILTAQKGTMKTHLWHTWLLHTLSCWTVLELFKLRATRIFPLPRFAYSFVLIKIITIKKLAGHKPGHTNNQFK